MFCVLAIICSASYLTYPYRVMGFIGLVRTVCNNPTKLHVHSKLEWPQYLGPISIVLLYCFAASNV